MQYIWKTFIQCKLIFVIIIFIWKTIIIISWYCPYKATGPPSLCNARRSSRRRMQRCSDGMMKSITPLNKMNIPAQKNPGLYDNVKSYKAPAIGGPISEATPWNNSNKPNALVNFSRPSKSTRITDVNPTYAPIVKPNTIE